MTYLDKADGLRGTSQEFAPSTDASDIEQQLIDATFNLAEHEYRGCSSDTPAGRSTFLVSWDIRVRAIDGARCEFTNRVRSSPSEDFLALLARQGIPFDQFRAQRQQASIEHLKNETPLFAASIERAALEA